MSAAPAQVLVVRAAGRRLALPAEAVTEVAALPPLTRVPHAPPALRGLANVRGRVLPVLSLSGGASAEDESAQIVVLGGLGAAVAVERVEAIRHRRVESGDDAAEDADLAPVDLDRVLGEAVRVSGRTQRRVQRDAAASEPAVAAEDLSFLEVVLEGQAYALPLEQVREVAPVPRDLRALPRTEAVMVGLADVRGRLVPVISPGALLGLSPPATASAAKLVLVHIGQACIALMVDSVRRVLRVAPDRVGVVPPVLNRGVGEARIDSVVRGPEGLVAVLAAERLLAEETVASILAEPAAATLPAAEAETRPAASERVVLFRLGSETYGMPALMVQEVMRRPEHVTLLPRAPAFIHGLVNHRGEAIPLVDQASRFGAPNADRVHGGRVIVCRVDSVKVGFIVDAVDAVVELPQEATTATPEFAAEDAVFDRVAHLQAGDRPVLVIEPQSLFDQAQRDVLAALAADMREEEPA